jgi:histidine triad (HIT) family protein
VLQATGASQYNVLQNNGPAAHQAVLHVHFHIIPRQDERGLGVGWKSASLDSADGEALAGALRQALAKG